jgi:hypothetical protein
VLPFLLGLCYRQVAVLLWLPGITIIVFSTLSLEHLSLSLRSNLVLPASACSTFHAGPSAGVVAVLHRRRSCQPLWGLRSGLRRRHESPRGFQVTASGWPRGPIRTSGSVPDFHGKRRSGASASPAIGSVWPDVLKKSIQFCPKILPKIFFCPKELFRN